MSRIRIVALLVSGSAVLGVGVVTNAALAHQCVEDENGVQHCGPAGVYDDWRPNYVPLFDLADREDEQQRRDAQRWRDEHGCDTQFCVWAKPSASVDDEDGPLTLHAGTAGDHSLTEGAHSDEGHDATEFGNHDTHGGAIYVDVCLGSDAGTSYDGKAGACTGVEDTQAGITVVDHLTCPFGCADEYHVVRPFDQPYTERQLENNVRDTQAAAADPRRHVCGHEDHSFC